jgi:pilus assembly protein CpaB
MNLKQSIPLVAAIGLGLVAAKVAHDMSAKKSEAADIKTVQMVVAKGPIGPGTALSPEMLDLTRIPGETLPTEAVASADSLLGRVTLVPIFDGQPVRNDFLAPKGTPAGLVSLVPKGMRAISVDVTETSSVAQLLTPGCHVDIVSTLGEDNSKMISRTIAQDIPILAVGQRLSSVKADGDKDQGYRTVTLLATPRMATLIGLASNTSRMRLVLRGVGDKAQSDGDSVSFVELKGEAHAGDDGATPVAMVTPAPTTQSINDAFEHATQHHSVEVIRGNAVSTVDFQFAKPASNSMTDTPNDSTTPQ